ncbi:MAG: hypothetical protein AMS27_10945 [Bacteroides sp. SM23_62_1]|nr:MAG: hypothetical protein AMS27_10945 [Bacteroides sp. SM23_62_1]
MKTNQKRRQFIITSACAGLGYCFLARRTGLSAMNHLSTQDDEIPDPKKLNYCGYVCPEDCPFLKGTLENDVELKKEAYKLWQIEERFGVEFDPEKIFCYGCKAEGKPDGIVLTNCTVRSCAMSKELDCCIECDNLADCDEDLWTRFPEFKNTVIEMQKKYRASQNI